MSPIDEKVIQELNREHLEKSKQEEPRYMAACRLESVLRSEVQNQTNFYHFSGRLHGWAKKYKLKAKAIRELCDLLESKRTK